MISITPLGGQVKIEGSDGIRTYNKADVTYTQVDSTHINLHFKDSTNGYNNIALEDLEIDGESPADIAALETAWAAVFHNAGGAAGTTLYTGDGALAGNRIVDLDGNNLQVLQGENVFFSIGPTDGGENVYLSAVNITGGGNYAGIYAETTDTTAEANIQASFNDGEKLAKIYAYADSGLTKLVYQSDTHEFEGQLILSSLPTSDPTVAGQLWNDAGTLKISEGII